MITLQENAAKFNNNLYVSHTVGRLSSCSSLIFLEELMNVVHFEDYSKHYVSFVESR